MIRISLASTTPVLARGVHLCCGESYNQLPLQQTYVSVRESSTELVIPYHYKRTQHTQFTQF